MKLYPILLNIEDRLVIVIGGGEVAFRKVKDLLEAGAIVRIISPDFDSRIKELKKADSSMIDLLYRKYQHGDLDGARLVYTSTDKEDVNRAVFREAEERGIFVNSVDDPPNCSFYVPSSIKRGDLILAVSTCGASPAMAARLRREFQKEIPENIEEIMDALREARSLLRNFDHLNTRDRGNILKDVVNNDDLLLELSRHYKSGQLDLFIKNLV